MPGYNFDMFTDPQACSTRSTSPSRSRLGQKASGRIKNLHVQRRAHDVGHVVHRRHQQLPRQRRRQLPRAATARKTIYASPDTNREVLIAYIKNAANVTRATHGSARSWRFTPVATAGKVVFSSGVGMLQQAVDAGLTNISLDKADDGSNKNLSQYLIDLSL